jgi:predicted ATPase
VHTNLMYLVHLGFPLIFCGKYTEANKLLDEIVALTNERGALYFNALGITFQGCLFAATSKALDSVRVMVPAITSLQSTGSTLWLPLYLSSLASAYGQIGQLANATRRIDEAITTVETTGESWCQAEINRVAGEIALLTPEPDAAKAEANFERALAVAREQQAKSWELRAAMSLARLWRDQGKVRQARELLAPVYGWFTEGFNTRDLKEAKALLEALAA